MPKAIMSKATVTRMKTKAARRRDAEVNDGGEAGELDEDKARSG